MTYFFHMVGTKQTSYVVGHYLSHEGLSQQGEDVVERHRTISRCQCHGDEC